MKRRGTQRNAKHTHRKFGQRNRGYLTAIERRRIQAYGTVRDDC